MSFQKGTLEQAQLFNDNRYLIKSDYDTLQVVEGDVTFNGSITFSQDVTIDGNLLLDDCAFIGIDSDTELMQLCVGVVKINGDIQIDDNAYIGIDSDTDLMQLKSGNVVLNGKLEVLVPGGTSYTNDWLEITGSIADNLHYPGIVFKGGTLVDEYPQIFLDNGGLLLALVSGIHTVDYTKKAVAYVTGAATEAEARFTVSNQDSDIIFDVLMDGRVGCGTRTPPNRFTVLKSTNETVSMGVGTTSNGNNGGQLSFYGAGGAELVRATGVYEVSGRSSFTVYTNNDSGTFFPYLKVDYLGNVQMGDTVTNYVNVDAIGRLQFIGLSRFAWQKKTANSLTVVNGTPTGTVAGVQSDNDGSFFSLNEVAGSPGGYFYVDFINVTAFNWVKILASYVGGGTNHFFQIQLYRWASAAWHTYYTCHPFSAAFTNYDFFVPNTPDFISGGTVRIRFFHTTSGNPSHVLYVDVVALYQ